MAAIKSINLLPEVFRSDVNKKFLAATVDQLVSEPDFRRIDGYVGRTFAPTYQSGDSYIQEPSTDRQNYQLEPSFVVQDANNNVTFYSSYIDLIQKIAYHGGITKDHSRLFKNESYNFNGLFDFDKFVNFNQYYWLPDGPPEVVVSANQETTVLNYTVSRDATRTAYTMSGSGTDPNPIVTLIKGTTYQFLVDQPGHPFWIQTAPGKTGNQSTEAEELIRTIFGLTNNGTDRGTVTFRVPSSTAQDSARFAERIGTVDYATTLTYAQLQNHLLSVVKNSGGIDGAASRTLDGRTLIFINPANTNDDWTDKGTFDFEGFDQTDEFNVSVGYEAGATVPGTQRFDIWRIRVYPVGVGNGLVRLERVTEVAPGQKVFVSSGVANAGVEYVKTSEGFWDTILPVTAPLSELYYQDGSSDDYAGIIRLLEPDAAVIDVTNDIIGRKNYTSPNGVKFTNGLKIRFDGTVTPLTYTNNLYIVEGVGKSIRLVNAGNLIVPEDYALNDLLATPDYITVSRGSLDLNAWSRSNRWFHSELINLAATYNNDPIQRTTTAVRAVRPIIEFESDLYLYNYGQLAKAPVDVLDYSVTDAFKQVEGQESYTIQLPNNLSRQLTAGTRIIFAADNNPEVRNRIYRVDFITTSERTQIHLVSQNTELLPTYYVSGAQLVETVGISFVGGNPDIPAEATLSVNSSTGEILDISFTNTGSGYRSAPEVTFVGGGAGTGAQIDIVLENGTIVDWTLVSGGSGYSTAPVYGFIPTVTFSKPIPSIQASQATGTAVMRPTTIANAAVAYGGINYIADPYLKISTTFTDEAVINPVYNTHKYVDHVRISNPGSSVGTTVTIVIDSPNDVEAVTTYANSTVFNSNVVTLNSTTGITEGLLVYADGVTGGTKVAGVIGPTDILLDAPASLTNETTFVFKSAGANSVTSAAVYANNTVFSTALVTLNSTVGINVGDEVYGPGIPTNTTVAEVFSGNAHVLLSDLAQIKNNRTYIFKPPSVDTATVTETVQNSTYINVDTTKSVSPGMYITGGETAIEIAAVEIDNPLSITTSVPHELTSGDSIVIRGCAGTIELNNNQYYVTVLSSTQLRLYLDIERQLPVDGRNFTDYTGSGFAAAFTIPYGVKVKKLIDENTLVLDKAITVKAGATVAFVGVRATADIVTDGSEVYAVKITDPGSGYLSVPGVTIDYGATTPTSEAEFTPILNDNVLEYFKIVYPGAGYEISNSITTEIISSVTLTTSRETEYGTRSMYFTSSDQVKYIKANWIALLVVTQNQQTNYLDFEQVPYVSTATTGPDAATYKHYMDVGLTNATVLKVFEVNEIFTDSGNIEYEVVLDGDINSLDSDGEVINLPANSQIYFSAKSKFFVDDVEADSTPIGEAKSSYTTKLTVADSFDVPLSSVSGLQTGMTVRDLSDSSSNNTQVKIVTINQVDNVITLNARVNLAAGIPLQFSSLASVETNLESSQIESIIINDPGAEYTSAPTVTVEPAIPAIVKLATSTGTNLLEVPDLDGITIGMNVTSEYSVAGDGVTTGAAVPKVIDLITEQTGTATYRYYVQLDEVQPVFEGLLVNFTLTAKVLAQIQSLNVVQTITNDTTTDTYEADDTVIVALPTAGQSAIKQKQTNVTTFNQYWYDGTNWLPAQQKTKYNQAPLFDIFNEDGVAASDTTYYQGSKFFGNKIFSYKEGIGTKDSQLGFALSYKNFQNVGDIQFENNFDTESFAYLSNKIEITAPVNQFLLKQKTSTGFNYRNIWSKAKEPTKQYQIITKFYDGITNYFEIDIFPSESETIPYTKVYVDNVLIAESSYQITTYGARKVVIIDVNLLNSDPLSKVDILIFSKSVSSMGYYQMPSNIDFNTENNVFTQLTLGQLRQHLLTMTENHYGLEGVALGSNNLRDLDVKDWTGSILQHSAPAMYSSLFLSDQGLEFVEAIEFAQKEYSKFKNKFIDQALKQELDLKNIPRAVDQLMDILNLGRNTTMPWYDSDMVPYGTANTTTVIPILNDRERRYQIPTIYNDTVPSRRSVLVYQVDNTIGLRRQLIKGVDFTFNQTISAIDLSEDIPLAYTQQLEVVDRPSTVGSYVPETPTKLGLHPKFLPRIYIDSTYQTPREVLQGHDGSLTPTFGDIRDQLLLELELRIYNNIKVDYQNTLLDVIDSIPGKFRTIDYSRAEFNQLLTRNFLRWAGNNKIDYNSNTTFEGNNPWTWNYKFLKDFTGEALPGFWRGIYQYYYDTDRPHVAPWEMLGFYEMPNWWTTRYGPAPYTGTNAVLWDDLELGRIAGGPRAGIDARFARPGLSRVIPVDEYGNLKSPEKFAPSMFDSSRVSAGWAVGDNAPAETAWRRSSEYPYALQVAIALSRPAFYFGTMFDTVNYKRNTNVDQLLFVFNKQRVTKFNFTIPDDGLASGTVNLTAGYVNWVRDWFANKAIDGTAKITNLVKNINVKMSYKMAGYSDPKFLSVVADQSSPVSTASSIILPQENYKIFLNKSAPLTRIVYSAVVIEKSTSGYSVTGYDLERPYFTIIPSKINQNAFPITAVNERATVYRDFEPVKVTIPYGYEFNSRQQVVDFLVSYGRFLIGQGLVFDTFNADLELRQDWVLSAKEFLTWSQQGWSNGNLLIVSPVFNSIKLINNNGVIDQVGNSLSGSRLLDQNFNVIKNSQCTVVRDENTFTITSVFGHTIGLATFNLVQYEHVLLLDNSTVFGDVIYQPELGNRQYRMRLVGNKTGAWTGQLNPAGFIYNSDTIDEWRTGKNYRKGSLISYKEKYYFAITDVAAAEEFAFESWNLIDKTKIKTGLLPNFAYNAEKFNNVYDLDNRPVDTTLNFLGQGITGFRDRSYFQDFDLDVTSQAKFYQGFVKQKGTINSVDALTTAKFKNLESNITLYDEWGLRVGDYGALGSDQSIEFELSDQSITSNPSTLVLINRNETPVDGLVNVDSLGLYRTSEDFYKRDPITNRADLKVRVSDSVTAGYPRLDDVDATIFDITEYQNYYNLVTDIGAGFKLWVAKDFNKSWNVYRANETDVLINQLQAGLDNQITIETNKPHGAEIGQIIVVKNFDSDYNGFYQVKAIVNATSFTVLGYRNLARLRAAQTITGVGILLIMAPVRFNKINDLVSTTPVHGWRDKDRVWIDNDVSEDVWAVFEKAQTWGFDQIIPIREGDARSNEGYGRALRISNDNSLVLAGARDSTIGAITGARIKYPGFLYEVGEVVVTPPTATAAAANSVVINMFASSGELLYTRTTSAGSNYDLLPNITIVDRCSATVGSDTYQGNILQLSSLNISVTRLATEDVYEDKFLTVDNINSIWVGDTVTGNDGTGNTIPSTVLVANINYNSNTVTLTNEVSWKSSTEQNISFSHRRVYVGDTVSGTDGNGNTIPSGTTVEDVTAGTNTVLLNRSYVSYTAGGTVTFSRGTGGNVQARLAPTTVYSVEVIDGGSGFTTTPIIELIGGDGTGAKAVVNLDEYGSIDTVDVIAAGSGYTYPPRVSIISTNTTHNANLRVHLEPSSVKSLIVGGLGEGYKHPVLEFSTVSGGTGSGAQGNVNVTNKSLTSLRVRSYGAGYSEIPTFTITDTAGAAGNGADLDLIYTTGLVKTFQYTEGLFNQVQNIPLFGLDANEFGYAFDIGTSFAFVGAPGSFRAQGAVSIARSKGSSWTSIQCLHPMDLEDGARFGHSVVCSKDERWVYVGAPGMNRVYVYSRKTTPTNQQKITVVNGEYSYLTTFVFVKNSAEIKVVGGSGKIYEPEFDYTISAGSLNFTNYQTIANETAIYASQLYPATTIVPTVIRGVLQTSYTLSTTPSQIEQINVIGADGRVFIPYQDYELAGVELTFVNQEFQDQASITVSVQPFYYIQVDVIEPNDQHIWDDGYRASVYNRIPIAGTVNTYDDMTAGSWTTSDLIKVLNLQEDGTYNDYDIYQKIDTGYSHRAIENRKITRGVAKFGSALATTNDGYQLVVGAPEATVNDGSEDQAKAGKIYVFDRSYQVFTGTGNTSIFISLATLQETTKITVDDIELTQDIEYTVSGVTINFVKPPRNGARIKVDVNQFNIIQSIETPDPVLRGYYGASVAISTDNKNIFVGSPGYRNVDYYNGRVYRYINQALKFGEIIGNKFSPYTTLGDVLRINDSEVIVQAAAGATDRIVKDVNNKNIIGITSRTDGISGIEFIPDEENNPQVGRGYFASNIAAVVDLPDISTGRQATIGNFSLFANGAIDTYEVTDTGSGYTFAPNVVITGGNIVVARAIVTINGGPIKLYTTTASRSQTINILPGPGTALDDLGIEVYAPAQVFEHPDFGVPEKFGSLVAVDNVSGESLLISSEGAATLKSSTFDESATVFDKDTTRFIDVLKNSGAVYVYDYLPIPGETLAEPSQYLYNQVLQNSKILFNDNFGSGIAINNDWIVVGASRSDEYANDAGAVHLFTNPDQKKGWSKLRTRTDKVDIDYINQAFLYNKQTQLIETDLDYYDPAKGKILGVVDQDLDYKTIYDPAVYNRTTVTGVTNDPNSIWNEVQLGKVWWNLDKCRYIDYEQGDLNYRISNWGELFPGSEIEVCEWVESLVLPSQYATATGNGEAKYADNSAYVEQTYLDPQSGLIRTRYYYWVKNKTSVDTANRTRDNNIVSIADIIQNPREQNIPYMAVVASNAFSLYNINSYLTASDIILKVEYATTLNENIAHSEYELVQQNNPLSIIPAKYINKLIDSLSGENSIGEVVPDLRLKENNQVGISIRPRQTMVKNPAKAIEIFVGYLNRFFATKLIAQSRNLSGLRAQEPVPPDAAGFYNQTVATIDELYYVPTTSLIDGYKVLVETDSTNEGYWTIYEFIASRTPQWQLYRIQSYDSTRFWDYADWYATGFNAQTQIDYLVQEFKDVAALSLTAGDIIKVLDDGQGQFELYQVDASLNPIIVGAENGTIQLSEALYNSDVSLVGFDNTGFDNIGFGKTGAIELRNIIESLFADILIETDQVEVNNVFFILINYILSEQKTLDWLLKTSFVSVVHQIRKLGQFPAYIRDQQDYFESYINEVKPYRTQIRSYLLDYTGLDTSSTAVADFDLPAIYDTTVKRFRALNPSVSADANLISSTSAITWLNNYTYSVQSISVVDAGTGYTRVPKVTITGGGGSGARAVASIDIATGTVTGVDMIAPGAGYTSTPTAIFTGGGGFGARAYVNLLQTGGTIDSTTLNKTVRSIKTVMSFDRTTFISKVAVWKPYKTYHAGDIIIVPDVTKTTFYNLPDQQLPRYRNAYLVLKTVLGTDTLDLNLFDDATVVQKLSGGEIDNAIDRLAAYNQPGTPDIASLFSSPDTNRLDASNTNNQVSSQSNQWTKIVHSVVTPATHEYQYLGIGDRGLVAISKTGTNWTVIPLAQNQLNLRGACFYNGTTWVAAGNQASLLYSDNGEDWTKEVVDQYRFSPGVNNPTGVIQQNASQAVDFTDVIAINTTQASYVIASGNGSNLLMNPFDTSDTLAQGWYSVKPQPGLFVVPIQFLTMFTQSFNDLTDINGTTYSVTLLNSGFFAQSAISTRNLQQGFVIVAGVNGNFFITSYARLDDLIQGYEKGYNYNTGKLGDKSYPWIEMKAPADVVGLGDGVSGEQISGIAMSGETDRWIVAVGSAGTLLWNKLDSPIQVRPGSADLSSDTIGQTVVDYGIEVFKNFRKFNADNFVSPLTPAALAMIDFNGITWDGEKFIAVGTESSLIWGYPGAQSEAYIELGNINPNLSARTRIGAATWDAVVNGTSLTMTILGANLENQVYVGMTAAGTYVPENSVVTSAEYDTGTDTWTIDIEFDTTNVDAKESQRVSFSYVFTDSIPVGTELTFDGPNNQTVTLTTTRAAALGDSIVYVGEYQLVGANWTISGTGIPTGARVKQVGKFAQFTWQYARSSGRDVNTDYNSVEVNTTTVQLAAPFTANIPANSTITFFDTTGTKLQLVTSQFLRKDTTTLTFANATTVGVGYTLEANATLGITGGTQVESAKLYHVGGILSHLAQDIPDLIPGTSYSGAQVLGQAYTQTSTDAFSLDTQITSDYTDSVLGTRPEDITINGGKYIDTFSSHAPQELVPGQVIDSLQMSVFTANIVNGNIDYGNVIAYKVFTDYKLPTVYYRLPAANTTVLTADLSWNDEEIAVDDITKLPDPAENQPGSIWLAGEKINYFGRDLGRSVLTNIRRGASRTSIPLTHTAGSIITDASAEQIIARDTVLPITADYTVENDFGNISIYQSALVSSVPQSSVWLNLGS